VKVDLELSGRVALVTGASAGIGTGIAKILAAEGAQTVLVARRQNLLDGIAREIETTGGKRPIVVTADLQDRASAASIAKNVLASCRRVDIVVNNAGASRPLPVDATDEAWDEAFGVNFTAVRKVSQSFLPGMQEAKWGRIINITGSLEPRSVNGANAAKAAVHIWAKGLACDVAKDGITVNCIGPGRIHSEQIDQRLHPTAGDQAAFAKANIPAGYFGDPVDVAYAVAFLCSPKARYITGQSFYIDGGMHRHI
jgi:3-oxoacyl-[acyl-carrier protein] reductase